MNLPSQSKSLRWFGAIGAGLVLAAAFPKVGITGAAWIAPALFVAASSGKKGAAAFRIGYVGGFVFWLATLYWLLLMPAPGFSILGWIALCAYLALFPAAWLALVQSAFAGENSWGVRTLWSMSAAAAWVALEMARGWLLGGFPWSFLGDSQVEMLPLAQVASITGVYGISFVIVWASLSLFSAVKMIVQNPTSRFAWQGEIFLPFLVVVALFVFGEIRLLPHGPPATTLNIAMIQPSVPQTLIWDDHANSNRFQELLQLSETTVTPETEVLVWPESAVPELDDAAYFAITNLVIRHHLWLIFNAEDVLPRPNARNLNDNDVFNAAFLLDPDGRIAAVYHKQALVIFGEYIPLEHSLPFIKYLTPVTGSFAAGTEPVPFPIDLTRWGEHSREPIIELDNGSRGPASAEKLRFGGRSPHQVTAAPLICFEDTFPSLARRATRDDTDFLVNLTNDGWFGNSAEQWQHEANAIFRAIENGIPLIRCANNGISCWIDPCGRVRKIFYDKTGSAYGTGAMTIELPLQTRVQTFYNRHGDWFAWICIGWSTLVTGKILYTRKRAKRNH